MTLSRDPPTITGAAEQERTEPDYEQPAARVGEGRGGVQDELFESDAGEHDAERGGQVPVDEQVVPLVQPLLLGLGVWVRVFGTLQDSGADGAAHIEVHPPAGSRDDEPEHCHEDGTAGPLRLVDTGHDRRGHLAQDEDDQQPEAFR